MHQKGTYLFLLLLKKIFFPHKACGILLPQPGIKPMSPVSPALAGRFFTTEPPGKFMLTCYWVLMS